MAKWGKPPQIRAKNPLGESLRTDAAPELPELRAGLRDWALEKAS